MPDVNIKSIREKITQAQETAQIYGARRLVAEVLGKNPAITVIAIDEVDLANRGIAAESVTTRLSSAEESVRTISEQTARVK
ncbi:MAG: tautomerase family protein, partial [Opitutus sp.]